MRWIDVANYYPGDNVVDLVLVRLSNDKLVLRPGQDVRGEEFDPITRTNVRATHWMIIERPMI